MQPTTPIVYVYLWQGHLSGDLKKQVRLMQAVRRLHSNYRVSFEWAASGLAESRIYCPTANAPQDEVRDTIIELLNNPDKIDALLEDAE